MIKKRGKDTGRFIGDHYREVLDRFHYKGMPAKCSAPWRTAWEVGNKIYIVTALLHPGFIIWFLGYWQGAYLTGLKFHVKDCIRDACKIPTQAEITNTWTAIDIAGMQWAKRRTMRYFSNDIKPLILNLDEAYE